MKLWMDVMRDMEHLMDDYERIFDGWQEGGVDGLVIGPPVFNAAKLRTDLQYVKGEKEPTEIFDPNPAVYKRFGVETPSPPKNKEPHKRAVLRKMLQTAKDRGLSIFFFNGHAGGGPGRGGHPFFDEHSHAATCARIVDRLEQFPMVDGNLFDGPEWGYEIAPHHQNHRSSIFKDLPETVRDGSQLLGYDFDALVAAKDRLYALLHNLDVRRIGLHGGGGFTGTLHLFGSDPDLIAWMRFRVESITHYLRSIRQGVDCNTTRPIKLVASFRSAAFAPLCGCDFAQLSDYLDVILPKHYFWQRGFDGLLGTVYRYVETLCEWNAGLSDRDALAVVKSLFGFDLPGVNDRGDLEYALTPEFYQRIVGQETRRPLAVVDDPDRIVPWVDTGRMPHAGDPMSAADLRNLILAAQDEGLTHFLYHHHGNLTAAEWVVMSEICGNRWEPRKSPYTPPDEVVL